jgi:hypothetical protein
MSTHPTLKALFLVLLTAGLSSCGHSNSGNSSAGGASSGSIPGCQTLNCASAPDNRAFYSKVSSKAFDQNR